MRAAADAHLHLLLRIASQVAADRGAGARADLETSVLVYEQLGVLSSAEATRWRERAASPVAASEHKTPSSPLAPDAVAAGRRHLESILQRISRPGAVADEFTEALDTMLVVGVLDRQEHARWRLALHDATGVPIGPPDSIEQAFLTLRRGAPPPLESYPGFLRASAATRAARPPAARPRATEILSVALGAPERHQGLAIVALVRHEDAVRLHFHHVGETEDPSVPVFERLEHRHEMTETLTPPVLTDDAGTAYVPVDGRPESVTGPGGTPDVPRMVSRGSWLYTPQAPDAASHFTVKRGTDRWHLKNLA